MPNKINYPGLCPESNFGFLQVYNIYCCYNNPKKLKLITKIFIR